jgi:hypothetical protein
MNAIWYGRCAVLALAAVVLGGCAALRIDVDVYKGPLANHEDIQVRQYAALAVAAKPVLATLRNRLEERETKGFTQLLLSTERLTWIEGDDRFRNDAARFVNGALSFYRDAGNRKTELLIEDLQRALESEVSSFRPFYYAGGVDEALAGALDIAARGYARMKLRHDRLAKVRELTIKFADAFSNFLRANMMWNESTGKATGVFERDEKKVQETCYELHKEITRLSDPADFAELPKAIRALECMPRDSKSANAIFELMSNPSVVATYSEVLLERRSDDFIRRVTEISQAFLDSRAASRAAWLANVKLVEWLAKDSDKRALQAAGQILVRTIQPRSLACYLTSQLNSEVTGSSTGRRGDLFLRLADGRSRWLPKGLFSQNIAWGSDVYTAAGQIIAGAAIDFPVEFTDLIRAAEVKFLRARDEDMEPCSALSSLDKGRIVPKPARKFGLARGPTQDTTIEKMFALQREINASTQVIAHGTAAGFERARPTEGIETLTEKFLLSLSQNRNDPNNKKVIEARRQLEESLILWAERVLVAVNNTALLPRETGEADADQKAREIAVLQAVANNVLVHADDIRRREGHAQRQQDRAKPELRAVRQAFELSPAQTFENLLRNLRVEIERLGKEGAPAAATTDGKTPIEVAKANLGQATARRTAAAQSADEIHKALATILPQLPAGLPKTDPGATKDGTDIVTLVAGLSADKNSTGDVLDVIVKAIEAASSPESTTIAGKESPRGQRLAAAKKYFGENKAALATTQVPESKPGPAKPASTQVRILGALQSKLSADARREQDLVVKLRREEADLDRIHKNAETQAKAAASASDFRDVLGILVEARGDVLKRADERGDASPQAMLSLLADALRSRSDAVTGNDAAADKRKANLALAMKVVRETTPPQAPALAGVRNEAATQKDVVDDVLALLRYQRTQALASGETSRAASLDNAISRLNEDRADMAYLRPASAYLRSVYASTSLQAEPDVAWVNLLSRNTERALGGGKGSAFEREYIKTRGEIDKQHWQTINTVTLAGGGNVNYVLAKDDIGNWYVKAYSADAGDIFKSAQGLALFGLGKGLDLNLLRRAQLQRQLDAPETQETAKEGIRKELKDETSKPGTLGTDALGRVLDRYRADHQTRTKSEADDLLKDVAKLRESIHSAWDGAVTGASRESMLTALKTKHVPDDASTIAEVKSANDTLTEAINKKDGTPAELAARQGAGIIRALESLRRMRDRLESTIKGDNTLVSAFSENYSRAQADLSVNRKQLDTDLAEVEKQIKADPPPDDQKKAQLERRKTELATSVKNLESDAAKARADSEQAVVNRLRAGKGAAIIINELVAKWSRQRLDTIRQMETALTIVGQAGAGGP